MLINRDYVGHMAAEVIKKLAEGELVEVKNAAAVTQRVRQAMMDEITVEDRISGRARGVLSAERTALNFLCRMSGIATAKRAQKSE